MYVLCYIYRVCNNGYVLYFPYVLEWVCFIFPMCVTMGMFYVIILMCFRMKMFYIIIPMCFRMGMWLYLSNCITSVTILDTIKSDPHVNII
jgi:hypothetical protein